MATFPPWLVSTNFVTCSYKCSFSKLLLLLLLLCDASLLCCVSRRNPVPLHGPKYRGRPQVRHVNAFFVGVGGTRSVGKLHGLCYCKVDELCQIALM
jgi:hypothetical protein